ncbi:hypothetical protein D9756_005387 [Leucocoprinus leucothites]|uniref:Uncharacterized protein n=1 Tax=Leucocoprinus leucothites TaxID=201217 RepID=A0A8H5FZ38_9AGAR|nr:hypothetical protein D9756_005387 [Leucoagaricus leucothites]
MIVIPCTRCTSSISATNRATNGHRFVFHSSEVVGMERHYIQDEPGVIPYEPTGVTAAASGLTSTAATSVPDLSQSNLTPREIHVSLPRPYPRNGSPSLESIPTPTLEQANPLAAPIPTLTSTDLSSPAVYSYPRSSDSRSSGGRRIGGRQPSPSLSSTSSADSSPPPLVSATILSSMNAGSMPAEQKDMPTSRALKPGDVLFWHHLTRCGEIPGVEDDKRARSKASARGTAKNNVRNMERRGRSLGRVVFGR